MIFAPQLDCFNALQLPREDLKLRTIFIQFVLSFHDRTHEFWVGDFGSR